MKVLVVAGPYVDACFQTKISIVRDSSLAILRKVACTATATTGDTGGIA